MKKIYILLTNTGTSVATLIHVFTRDKYAHSAISFDKSLDDVYSFARIYDRLVLPGGLKTEDLYKGVYKRNPHMPCSLLELEVEDEVYYAAKSMCEQMISHKKDFHYNIIGLLMCAINVPVYRDNYFTCSEFVGTVLTKSGALKLEKPLSLVKPMDYYEMNNLTHVYEGKLSEMLSNVCC